MRVQAEGLQAAEGSRAEAEHAESARFLPSCQSKDFCPGCLPSLPYVTSDPQRYRPSWRQRAESCAEASGPRLQRSFRRSCISRLQRPWESAGLWKGLWRPCCITRYPLSGCPWAFNHQSINYLHPSSTMAGCVQGDRVFLSSKPLYPEPALPKMARSQGHPDPLRHNLSSTSLACPCHPFVQLSLGLSLGFEHMSLRYPKPLQHG